MDATETERGPIVPVAEDHEVLAIILFFLGQRQFIEGISAGAVKG